MTSKSWVGTAFNAESAEAQRARSGLGNFSDRSSVCFFSAFSAPLRSLRQEWLAALARHMAFLCLLCSAAVNPAYSKEAAPLAQDEAVEKRMVAISSELRCLVCQNESLSASNAELAHDLRREIRSQIAAGKSDGEIRDFMVSRYGDFVLYRPPLKGTTLLLWFGPALFFPFWPIQYNQYLRRRKLAIKDVPLTAAEQAELDRLLSAKDPKD